MKTLLILMICSFIFGCSVQPVQKPVNLIGKWKTVDNPANSFVTIEFKDSTAVFDTPADTVLRFKYHVDKNHVLWLKNIFGRQLSTKIIRYGNDSLIFDHLWDSEGIQHFVKK